MWPINGSRGTSIGYGHKGSGLYLPFRSKEPWLFARTQGNGDYYYLLDRRSLVQNNPKLKDQRLVGEERYFTEKFSIRLNSKAVYPDVFIPSHLASERLFESENIDSAKGYDASWGDLLSVHRNGQIAYASGTYHASVCVGNVTYEQLEIENSGESWTAGIPKTTNMIPVKVQGNIKQVHFQDTEEDESSEYLLVRSDLGINMIYGSQEHNDENEEIEEADRNTIDTPVKSQLNSNSWQNIAFVSQPHGCHSVNADINPFYPCQIVSFYSDNTWKIYNIDSECPKQESSQTWKIGPIISNHHTVKWGHDSHSVLLGDRLNLKLFDIRSNEAQDVLTIQKNNAQICDLQRVTNNNNEIFILTTNQVLWKDLRNPKPCLLEWEHHLNARDPSLKLCTTTMNDLSIVSAYSAYQPFRLLFQFCRKDGFPISAEDPLIFNSDPSDVTQTCQLLPLAVESSNKKILASLNFNTSYGLTGDILCSEDNCRIKSYEELENETRSKEEDESWEMMAISEPSRPDYENPFLAKKPVTLRLLDFRNNYKLTLDAIDKVRKVQNDQSSTSFQINELARGLGKAISDIYGDGINKIMTMQDLLEGMPINLTQLVDIDNNDFDKMLQELIIHYRETLITIKDSIQTLAPIFGEDLPVTVKNIYNHLKNLYIDSVNETAVHKSLLCDRVLYCKLMAINLRFSLLQIVMQRKDYHKEADFKWDITTGLEIYTDQLFHHVNFQLETLELLEEWDIPQQSNSRVNIEDNVAEPESLGNNIPTGTSDNYADTVITTSKSQPFSGANDSSSLLRQTRSQTAPGSSSQLRRSKRRKRNEGFG